MCFLNCRYFRCPSMFLDAIIVIHENLEFSQKVGLYRPRPRHTAGTAIWGLFGAAAQVWRLLFVDDFDASQRQLV